MTESVNKKDLSKLLLNLQMSFAGARSNRTIFKAMAGQYVKNESDLPIYFMAMPFVVNGCFNSLVEKSADEGILKAIKGFRDDIYEEMEEEIFALREQAEDEGLDEINFNTVDFLLKKSVSQDGTEWHKDLETLSINMIDLIKQGEAGEELKAFVEDLEKELKTVLKTEKFTTLYEKVDQACQADDVDAFETLTLECKSALLDVCNKAILANQEGLFKALSFDLYQNTDLDQALKSMYELEANLFILTVMLNSARNDEVEIDIEAVELLNEEIDPQQEKVEDFEFTVVKENDEADNSKSILPKADEANIETAVKILDLLYKLRHVDFADKEKGEELANEIVELAKNSHLPADITETFTKESLGVLIAHKRILSFNAIMLTQCVNALLYAKTMIDFTKSL